MKLFEKLFGRNDHKELGTAKFNAHIDMYKRKFITPYTEEDIKNGKPDPNILFGEGMKLSLTGEGLAPADRRNTNVLVVGGSGSGKTFSYIKPNILQCNSSFVCNDPHGEIMKATKETLLKNGYTIKIFSVNDTYGSNIYNPLDYIYNDEDKQSINRFAVKNIVKAFLESNSSDKGPGDVFWNKAAGALIEFGILYLAEFMEPQDRNFVKLRELIKLAHIDDYDSTETDLDKIVLRSKKIKPDAECFALYDVFKLFPSKTVNSLVTSLEVEYFSHFRKGNPGDPLLLGNITTTDYMCERDDKTGEITDYIRDKAGHIIPTEKNINPYSLGDEKTALFIDVPQSCDYVMFIFTMLYETIFASLYQKAKNICPNRWYIYDKADNVIGADYKSPEEAGKFITLYSNAEIKEENGADGEKHYYIYNKEAAFNETIKTKAYTPVNNGGGTGYLREVYDKRYAQKLINSFKDASIKRGEDHLPIPVHAIMDEFAYTGRIIDIDKILATDRKYRISISIIVQSIPYQLMKLYKDKWESIVANCDSLLYMGIDMGSNDYDNAKYISDLIGKKSTTIVHNGTLQRIKSDQYIISPEDILKMDNDSGILFVRGVNPIIIKKYDCTKHPNYKN